MAEIQFLSEDLEELSKSDSVCKSALAPFLECLESKESSEIDVSAVFDTLADLAVEQNRARVVATHFQRHIPLLLTKITTGGSSTDTIAHQKRCIALSKLLDHHADAIKFVLQYFKCNPSPFESASTERPQKKRKIDFTAPHDKEVLQTCLVFLLNMPEYFSQLWDWSNFAKVFMFHEEPYVQWLACQCLGIVLNMSDNRKLKFISNCMKTDDVVNSVSRYSSFESKLQFDYNQICQDIIVKTDDEAPTASIGTKDLVSVNGIVLPVYSKSASCCLKSLVPVKSAWTNIQAVALGVAIGRALCLQGPVGCGKTALVEYLANVTGRCGPPSFMKIQLGDQTDSKMLLGSYQCTDVPGEFVWQPGVLTEAVSKGHWLLLEDIDSCTTDVAAVIMSLLESRTLSVPGYRDCISAAPGFQLFLTRRLLTGATGYHKQHAGASHMLEKLCLQVQVEPIARSELIEIIQTLYPSLSTVASRMVDIFLLFSAGEHQSALNEKEAEELKFLFTSSVRLISTRDLLKWCSRAVKYFVSLSVESARRFFQDSLEIFCLSNSKADARFAFAKLIAAKLGIIHTEASYFCQDHKPVINNTSSEFVVGRVTLVKEEKPNVRLESKAFSKYSFTRPAACLLECIAACVDNNEPVLLVGETGVGKTSCVQYLAQQLGHKLSVINMNQQSDSSDLLGGYKPVELKHIIAPIRNEFECLFRKFFNVEKNVKFLQHISKCFSDKRWKTLVSLMSHSTNSAVKRYSKEENCLKENPSASVLKAEWLGLSAKLQRLEAKLLNSKTALAFSFVEGCLVKAIKEGAWVLLDEINLATAETLECLSGLLEGSSSSLSLLERGDRTAIKRHPNFRIFAAMNPATDVGKKELPPGIRNRFTEFYVDELTNRQDLLLLCDTYLSHLSLPAAKKGNLVDFYTQVRQAAVTSLSDGTGQKPHYSLRTLCRALRIAAENPCGSVSRSLYESFLLSFLTQLDHSSHPVVEKMVALCVFSRGSKGTKAFVNTPIIEPSRKNCKFTKVEDFWVAQGPLEPIVPEKYILTPTVRRNLHDLVRVVSLAHLPVLLQGETSVGKTSLITYLAQLSGNRCVRINNHEHTDLQEYIGCYSADEQGRLTFKEGVLVEAMRNGYWIILDELNLAPSDVLEALNRVLDDNRELFIPETQEVVKAHSNFMLFATQNPPGLYGGRKVLSRAFRNRFIELHFDEIPSDEIETILHLRCDMPKSYCRKMVAVMADLQVRRKGSAAFAGKHGFITLRDLFRWGERYRLAQVSTEKGQFYDWDQHLADEGYLILAGRVRKPEEEITIREALMKHMKRSVHPNRLFTLSSETSSVTLAILKRMTESLPSDFSHIVWTYNISRLAVLLGKAFEFVEPVLIVGETGCGKTTMCQLFAALSGQVLATVNCHMHTESADFLGGLRPVREHTEENQNKLFEWVDGPLIKTMNSGGFFLADEINLADDSVLERLNSLLEPERKLLLSEKGSHASGEPTEITAKEGFIFVGTMNPGGDFGKKELSPALRNRFTEIWCEGCSQRSDIEAVIEHNLRLPEISLKLRSSLPALIADFLDWFRSTEMGKRFSLNVRDILTWVQFINLCAESTDGPDLTSSYIHGACLTFLDSLGAGVTSIDGVRPVKALRHAALDFLKGQVEKVTNQEAPDLDEFLGGSDTEARNSNGRFGIHPFYIDLGDNELPADDEFLLSAPTTRMNALRVLRGLQLGKAILLEGSPGVGKTSLVSALARCAGHTVTRINLSDQTDVSDLFGADLPVEGGQGGQFAWRDGPFLRALRAGHWILLDELNLASQSVLEGLNAVLDHRGDLFIPELGRTFHIESKKTRLFGCQNPLNQGGARRGLPQSFLNRFTQVHIEALSGQDIEYICKSQFSDLPDDVVSRMVAFNSLVSEETRPGGKWGQRGSPWEMNLRDLSRWCQATLAGRTYGPLNPGRYVDLIYMDRMRTLEDREKMKQRYVEIFGSDYPLSTCNSLVHVFPDFAYLGEVPLTRVEGSNNNGSSLVILRHQAPVLQSLARCAAFGWMSILVGQSGCGKSSMVHLLSEMSGRELRTLSVNSAMDTTEILGGFEQADYTRHFDEIKLKAEKLIFKALRKMFVEKNLENGCHVLTHWSDFLKSSSEESETLTMESGITCFKKRVRLLQNVLKSMLKLNPTKRISFLLEDLDNLLNKVEEEKSLNAGGKFEWIDSVLVKSLRDGCWLLIDNVNLCSAAVLDRLNGLLEPNGVLTIGERGVKEDGQLVTIQPHSSFRLFLTMDPRYGEISRAMRNRGVEIYVPGPEEYDDMKMPALDVAALLYATGLRDIKAQSMLQHIHQVMNDLLIGPSKPTLGEELQAAFLIVQQVKRGINFQPALMTACTKVYVQSRLSDSMENRRHALSVLKDTISSGIPRSPTNILNNLINLSTLNTSKLNLNSILAVVKQRGALISTVSRAQNIGDIDEISDFLSVQKAQVEPETLLEYLVLTFYQTCSPLDVDLGHKWLQNDVKDTEHGEVAIQLSEAMRCSLNSARDLVQEQLIWDRRWLPDVAAGIAARSGAELNYEVENRVNLMLYYTVIVNRQRSVKSNLILKRKEMSVMDYSRKVKEGKMSESLFSQPLIAHVAPFLEHLSQSFIDALGTNEMNVSEEEWWNARRAFFWLEQMRLAASSLMVSKKPELMNDAFKELNIHFHWLKKYTVPIMSHLVAKASVDNEVTQIWLQRLVENDSLNKYEKVWRIGKKYRVFNSPPLPHSSKEQAKLSQKAQRLNDLISLWSTSRDQIDRKIYFLLSFEGVQAKAAIETALFGLSNDSDLELVSEQLRQASHLLQKRGAEIESLLHTQKEGKKKEVNLKIALWPLKEAVCLALIGKLRSDLYKSALSKLQKIEEPVNVDLIAKFVRLMKMVPTIPASVVSAVELVQSGIEPLSSFMSLFNWEQQSLSSRTLLNLLSSNSNEIGSDDNKFVESSLHCPVISQSVSALITNQNFESNDLLATSSLEHHSIFLEQLKQCRCILWRNSSTFSSPELNFNTTAVSSVLSATEKFVNILEQSCGLPSLEDSIKKRAQAVMASLFVKSDQKLNDLSLILCKLLRAMEYILQCRDTQSLDCLFTVGELWVHLSAGEIILYSATPQIDPMRKHGLKLTYVNAEIAALNAELLATKMMYVVRGGNSQSELSHPLACELSNNLKRLEDKKRELSRLVAVRPDPPRYNDLDKDIKHFATTIGSVEVISHLARDLRSIVDGSAKASDFQKILQEAKSRLQNIDRFSLNAKNAFMNWYPDIIQPLFTSCAQLTYGINLMVGVCEKFVLKKSTALSTVSLDSLVSSLACFPYLCTEQPSVTALTSFFTSEDASRLLLKCISSFGDITDAVKIDKMAHQGAYWLLKSAFLELKNYIIVSRSISSSAWQNFLKILRQFHRIWDEQENMRREKEKQEESLYKSRGAVRCQTFSEEEEIERSIAEIFPSNRESDFGDLEPTNLLEDSDRKLVQDEKMVTSLSNEDVVMLSSIHMNLTRAYSRASWLENAHGDLQPDFLNSWLLRLKVASCLISSNANVLNHSLDQELTCSWALAASLAGTVNSLPTNHPDFDFYQSSCVDETKQCSVVLEGVAGRVIEFLEEWPDHPTLKQIIVVIDRVMAFPFSSPIPRFLTGLEILLSKMREWEENAHSGVSLATQSATVTDLIFQWRRLELSCWKSSLNSAFRRIRNGASRLWFYLFDLFESYLEDGATMNTREMLTALERFMEEASIGEYQIRLEMLLAFHCHVVNSAISDRQNTLSCMLWNLHGFYSQFSQAVENYISEQKSPIDKKLKDYVKIARWNDINYWAAKDTVFKTQRTLHKHIREFEAVLKQPSRSVLNSSKIEGRKDSKKKIKSFNQNSFIANSDAMVVVDARIEIGQETLLSRPSFFYNRSRKLSKDLLKNIKYPSFVTALDEFAGEVADTVQQLASVEVDRSLPKPKQVSQAKNQLQVKRKALADLFRTLQLVGLSFRTGLTFDEDELALNFALLPPLQVAVALKTQNLGLLSSADRELMSTWDGCGEFFLRSVARSATLKSALRKPHKDVGQLVIDRVRGFVAHFTVLAQEQHKDVNKNLNTLIHLKNQMLYLSSMDQIRASHIPRQDLVQNWFERLQGLAIDAAITLEQFQLLLNACPDEQLEEEIPVLTLEGLPEMVRAVRGDSCWLNVSEQTKSMLTTLSQIKENMLNFQKGKQKITLVRNEEFTFMKESFQHISLMAKQLGKIRRSFESNFTNSSIKSLKWLETKMTSECDKFNEDCLTDTTKMEQEINISEDFSARVGIVIHKILVAIQDLYKTHCPLQENKNLENTAIDNIEEENDTLKEKHLSDILIRSLKEDFKKLKMEEINKDITCLVKELTASLDSEIYTLDLEKSLKLLSSFLPLLEQWILLCQYLILQQVGCLRASSKLLSIVLAVFESLSAKGFCVPDDLSEEVGDGEGQSDAQQQGGMGLGDGVGEKDVSDRIESEDQLEDARPAGEEPKTDNQDCREEKNGIEMSENFEGNLQDMEPKGDDNEDDETDEEDNDDAEKEMGDTEKDADRLDEQVWGSDSEEEDEASDGEDGENGDERGNSGEQIGDKEMGARENDKDGSKQENEEEEDSKGKGREKPKPEINEMLEPEGEDQMDPHHGNQQPDVEPEPMDLPEDLQLDEGDAKDGDEGNEENPFDIDAMKEQMPPEQKEEESKETGEKDDQNKDESDLSDDENLEKDNKESDKNQAEDAPEIDQSEDEIENQRKDGKKLEENEGDIEEQDNDTEERNPSHDDPSSEQAQTADNNEQGSKDQVLAAPKDSNELSGEQPPEDADGDPGADEREAIGQAPTNQQQKGHLGDRAGKMPKPNKRDYQEEDNQRKRQRPGHSEQERTLADNTESQAKRLKTLDAKNSNEPDEGEDSEGAAQEEQNADLFQHVKDAKERSEITAMDVATEDQAKQQSVVSKEEMEEEDPSKPDDEIMDMDVDPETDEQEEVGKSKADKVSEGTKKNKKEMSGNEKEQSGENDKVVEVEGEKVQTLSVARGPDSTFHTRFEELFHIQDVLTADEMKRRTETVRKQLIEQLAMWDHSPANDEAQKVWQSLSAVTCSLARDLSEQLRLVLEPTQASRLRGDFRTGRRINMRKVIPYIASQFRKDKIWLRRTKPSKREYQIVLAIDDSSSMADNRSKELAFESLALVSQALTLLEVGELGVLSFGETIKILHKLDEPFTHQSGARLLQQFSFEQRKTQVGALMEFVSGLMTTSKVRTSAEHAQLVVVVSDGRGVFSEGQEKVCSAVRRARLSGIFMIFIIIDNPENKDSILDIRTPTFKDGQLAGITPYMDSFPFPFYLILRDISNLPSVLSDALRQWFELVTST